VRRRGRALSVASPLDTLVDPIPPIPLSTVSPGPALKWL
jgi:hypothetical protein